MNFKNKKMMNDKMIGFLMAIVIFTGCKKKDSVTAELTVAPSQITLPSEGGLADINITGNSQWSISNLASWLVLSKASGNSGSNTIQVSAMSNETGASRSTYLSVNSSNGQARRVKVTQPATIYPSYNTSPKAPDSTGMSNAVQLAAKFKLGWNIGNTLEAPNGETGWGNPQITESYIKFVKQQGFTAIRLPCAWNWTHLSDEKTAKIDPAWLNRVKEIVGYCVNNDLYVMLNIHWDGGWLENNISKLKQDSVNAKQKALWEQIATTMRDFDEHLMFASANEPAAHNTEETEILSQYHQTFINAVRSTGGKNSHRVLILQGPSTSASLTAGLMTTLPKDPAANRLMVEVHNYTPSLFCFIGEDQSWGRMIYYWGNGNYSTIEPDRNATFGEESEIISDYNKVKTSFIDKGIPVIMGEYGAYRRKGPTNIPKDMEKHEASVDYWTTFTTKEALARGIKPFWWDTGGALDRANNTVKDQRTIDALMAATK